MGRQVKVVLSKIYRFLLFLEPPVSYMGFSSPSCFKEEVTMGKEGWRNED